MKTDKKITLGIIGGSVLTVLALVGSTAGTLSWYAYSRNVSFSYMGTSVQKSILLNMGIVDNAGYIKADKIQQYDLVRETHDGRSIVFTQSTKGLDINVIRAYLESSPNAVDMLFPVTSQNRSLASDDNLTIYKSPDYGDDVLMENTDPSAYVVLPFAFRIADENSESISDKEVWLTDAVVEAEKEHIEQAVRVFVHNESSQRKFLMKPAEKDEKTGFNKVGGLLDLDGDGYYDYNKLTGYEYYYGEFTGTKTWGELPDPDTYVEDYENANGVVPIPPATSLEPSTFYAKHSAHTRHVDLSQLTPQEVEYYTLKSVKPATKENGEYYVKDDEEDGIDIGIPIASTSSSSGIGYATFTIFIEGWDHTVVDKAAGYSFNLGLRFEINR